MNSRLNLIKSLTGTWPVYPGHPLVVAVAVMHFYPNYSAASTPTASGWAEALGDIRIPGAGCHVTAAMRTLELGVKGASIDEMVAYAKHYWTDGGAGGHSRFVADGEAQADAIESTFREMAKTWITSTTPIEPHQV